MRGKLLIILLVLLFASSAFAETLWVRPSDGEYGAEDGSDYDNAFDGWADISWGEGAGSVGPGDTLIVSGTWIYRENYSYSQLVVGDSGESGNEIIIEFGDDTHPAIIIGSEIHTPGDGGVNYTDKGGGVWAFNQTEAYYKDGLAYGASYDTATALTYVASKTPGEGEWYVEEDGGDPDYRTYFINPPGDPNQAQLTNTYYNWRGCSISPNGNEYIIFNGGTHYFSSRFFTMYGNHITLRNASMYHVAGSCIGISSANTDDIEIHDNFFKYFKQVTYPGYGGGSYNHTNWHIHDNIVDGVGQTDRTTQTDGHIFGGQNISDAVMENNYIYNCEGDAFLVYRGQNELSFCRNNIVRRNFVVWSGLGDLYARGVDYNGSNESWADENMTGNEMYQNIFVGAKVGFRSKFGYSITGEEYTKVWNNVFINCGVTIRLAAPSSPGCGNGVDLRNNISLSPTTHHISIGSHDYGLYVQSDYNIFYPDTSEGAPLFTYNGVDCDNFADWQTDSGSQDSHSYTSDPLLTGEGAYDEATDVQTKEGSPARNNGTNVGLSTDYAGTSLPQGGAYDIGAYEYYGETPDVNYTTGVELSGVGVQ